MTGAMDWVVVKDGTGREIGAIGFIGNTASVIATFYDHRDGNYDGQVSVGERIASAILFNLEKKAITEVAMAGSTNMEVMRRDASFGQAAIKIWLNFAGGLITDGIYIAYFSRGVKAAAGGVAGAVTENAIKQFVIRKGMEKAVRDVYDASVRP